MVPGRAARSGTRRRGRPRRARPRAGSCSGTRSRAAPRHSSHRASRCTTRPPSTRSSARSEATDGAYAIVGVPCFITAMRHLEEVDADLRDQFTWHIGLVCGHLKSQFFAESLAWQAGVPPEDLEAIDFRVKNPARRSYSYDYEVRGRATGAAAATHPGGHRRKLGLRRLPARGLQLLRRRVRRDRRCRVR